MKEFKLDCGIHTLAGYAWEAAAPRACVVLLHGVGEYARRHNRLAVYLTRAGFSVYAMDLPGHGHSPGRRGHIGSTDSIMRDINILITYAREHCPDVPFFVMGHSMGGNLALSHRYYFGGSCGAAGYIASSPWLVLKHPPSGAKLFLARVGRVVAPSLSVRIGLDPRDVCANPVKNELDAGDMPNHDFISPMTSLSRLEDAARVLEAAGQHGPPVYLLHGSADNICDVEGSRRFAAACGNCTYRELPGLSHETMNEEPFEDIIRGIVEWIDGQLAKNE